MFFYILDAECDAIMKLVKEIKSKEGIVHFQRYELLKTPWFICYLHKIYERDKDLHLHNHPWKFLGIIIKGSYIEQRPDKEKIKSFGSLGWGDQRYFHKIKQVINPTISLFFVSIKTNEWGYQTEKGFIDHKTYRSNKR